MIDPDDISLHQTHSRTPMIALSVAGLLLLVIGGLSYRDYVKSSLEKEYTEKELALKKSLGLPVENTGTPAASPAAPTAPGTSASTTGTVLYDAQGNPVYLSTVAPNANPSAPQTQPNPNPGAAPSTLPPVAASPDVEKNLPRPEDPEIASMRNSLEAAKKAGQATEQRMNEVAGNGMGATPTPGAGTTEITPDLPDFLRDAVNNPPGGNPQLEAQLNRQREQIKRAPSIGKVLSYDPEWGVVTFDAGADELVKVDQRFAVRRGTEVLGWVKVNQVDQGQSIATLITKNANSDTAIKPEIGDELIDFELY